MCQADKPFIDTAEKLPELTMRVVILAVVLAFVLATSNAYLALKIGLLTSASIPAAIISMGILKLFKNANILENNLVQTAASAGEAVSGGIVYTVPALILLHYWGGFPYWQNVAIALLSGILGVCFSIPLRKILVQETALPFPEGRAVAQVLIAGTQKNISISEIISGGIIGAVIELAQTGFKVVANSAQHWFSLGKSYIGFGAGFSATMVGAGYLIGFDITASIMIGALLGWLIAVPILSEIYYPVAQVSDVADAVRILWGQKIRYIGIGAMLVAGTWTLLTLIKPFMSSMKEVRQVFQGDFWQRWQQLPRVERDMPLHYVMMMIVVCLLGLYGLFCSEFPLAQLSLSTTHEQLILFGSVIYVCLLGFILVAICSYFSGMVGVTASPGSAVTIAAMIIAALVFRTLFARHPMPHALQLGAVMTVFVGSIIQGAACLANDNTQDLKVGYLVGATPWKQQLMLMIGVVVASLIIPIVMQLLFSVYGIGDILPRPDMDITQALPAPPAALMAAVTQGVFHHRLPWDMMLLGGLVSICFIIICPLFKKRGFQLSTLGIATGIYLPLATSVPLFVGGLMSLMIKTRMSHAKANQLLTEQQHADGLQKGLLLACGLVSGAALMDVILAVPFSIAHSPDVLRILPHHWQPLAEVLGILTTIGLAIWMGYTVQRR